MTLGADQRQEWIRSRRKRRKAARRARMHRQLMRYFLLCALLVGGVSAFFKIPWAIQDPIKDIEVKGNSFVAADQIRGVLGNAIGVPIYRIDPKALEKQVTTLACVRQAFVRRYALPKPTIVVEVLEEFPWACFSTSPEAVTSSVVAQSGRFIPIKDFPRVHQPALEIYGPPALKLTHADVAQWAGWIAFIEAQTNQPVESIDLRKPFDVSVVNGDLFIKLGTPDTTLSRRLGRLSSVLSAIQPLRSRLEYIDLGLDNNIPLKLAKKSDADKQQIRDLQTAQLAAPGAL